jgi:hypothetical protein
MHGVKTARFFLGEAQRFDGYDRKAGLMNPAENFPLQIPANSIGFN